MAETKEEKIAFLREAFGDDNPAIKGMIDIMEECEDELEFEDRIRSMATAGLGLISMISTPQGREHFIKNYAKQNDIELNQKEKEE